MSDEPAPSSPSDSFSTQLTASGDIAVGGDVVGRDKIVQNIRNIYERALTAAEAAQKDRAVEAEALAQGVSAFAQRLQARAADAGDAVRGGPYKGLLEYRLGDAEIFFGRQRAVAGLLEHLQRGPLTVLHAESGAGKTSLLQAGVAPRLILAGHLPISLRPYDVDPGLALKRALVPDLGLTPLLATAPLRDFVRQVNGVVGPAATLYIFLDQFEEFFTQLPEPPRRDFVRELAECLEDESLNARWVLSLRTEHFGSLAAFRPAIANPFENDYRLARLTRAEAHEVVSEPAARRGLQYEPGLIDAILDELGKDEVAPPEVQLVCSALYQELKPGETTITRALYVANGGAAGILREHVDRVLSRDVPAGQRPVAHRLLEALITSDLHRVIRRRAELASELGQQALAPADLDALLGQLVDSRLLRVHEGQDGEPAYELAHDYLLEQVRLDPAVQARKAAQELLEQEVRAFQHYRTLLSDDKLAILTARRAELRLDGPAQELLRLSEGAARRRRSFVVGGIGLVAVLLVVGVISIVAAFGAQRERGVAVSTQAAAQTAAAQAAGREAQASTQAAAAVTQQAQSQAAAVVAATQASEADARVAAARQVLRSLFDESQLVPVGNGPAAFVSDGARLWVANQDGHTLQAIDPASGVISATLEVAGAPRALAYDGRRLWAALADTGAVAALDPATGAVIRQVPAGSAPVALAFDGARLWVADQVDNTVQAIDPETSQVVLRQELTDDFGFGAQPFALLFDGQRVWVANQSAGTLQAIDPATGVVSPHIAVGSNPVALAYDGQRVWVAVAGENRLVAVDPVTGQLEASLLTGPIPFALAFDGTRLWAATRNDNRVQAFDPVTGDGGAPIPVGNNPVALTFVFDRVWVANFDGDTVQAVTPVRGDFGPLIPIGALPAGLAIDESRLWVASPSNDTVQAIDLDAEVAQPAIPIPVTSPADFPVQASPSALVLVDGRLWVANTGTSAILPIDVDSGEAAGPPIFVASDPGALVFDGARLWVASASEGVVQPIDATGQAGSPMPVGKRPVALAFDGALMWAANAGDNAVQAFDPESPDMSLLPVVVGANPSALLFDGTRLWVANLDDDSVQAITPLPRKPGSLELHAGEAGPPIPVGAGPLALAFDGRRLWVATTEGALRTIDPVTGFVGRPVPLPEGFAPAGLAYDSAHGRLWVATANGGVQYVVVHP